MAVFTRYSPLALGLAVWFQAASCMLMPAQITSCNFVSGWSSDNEIPVLCKQLEFSGGRCQLDTVNVWLFGVGISVSPSHLNWCLIQ